jgi:tripartite-type tricarboxylate transporter receptor subunit TctC
VFHLTGELFKQLTGLALQHVPYRGGGPTVTALLAGEIPLAFETMLALQPDVRAGTLRALAITSARRCDARDPHHRGVWFSAAGR